MRLRGIVAIIANFLLIAGLVRYGMTLFADYHATGKWAKNVTALLASLGVWALAVALLVTPANSAVLAQIAETKASIFFLWVSSVLLLAAIAAFGIITYSRPLRLWHERRLARRLNRELPFIQ
jgi:hypothetical protein